LALSLAFSGENEEAIGMLSELSRELGAGARVRQNLALVYSLAGRTDDAAAIAQRDLTGARLRHNLALYESLRGVNGPRLAADVVCGGGRGALMYSSAGRDRISPRGGQITEAGRRTVAAPDRPDPSSWRAAERGAIEASGTGHVRPTKAQTAAESVDLAVLRSEEKAGSSAETSVVSYTVRHGDTLSLIAKKYYGNARKYVALAEANRGTLPHPDKIYPGMVVNIPALG
jgi:nucleoid-associated protein YgaU